MTMTDSASPSAALRDRDLTDAQSLLVETFTSFDAAHSIERSGMSWSASSGSRYTPPSSGSGVVAALRPAPGPSLFLIRAEEELVGVLPFFVERLAAGRAALRSEAGGLRFDGCARRAAGIRRWPRRPLRSRFGA